MTRRPIGLTAPYRSGTEREAQDRLFDILLGDDGQAWKEAERYLQRERPDLWIRLEKKAERNISRR